LREKLGDAGGIEIRRGILLLLLLLLLDYCRNKTKLADADLVLFCGKLVSTVMLSNRQECRTTSRTRM
jgi:hypothetical protein